MRTAVVELEADHPGFHDAQYRQRRNYIAQLAINHPKGAPPPRVEYTPQEVRTWTAVYNSLLQLYPTYACPEYCAALPGLGYGPNALPQLADVSAVLQARTGFCLTPVAGLVSPRDFLTALGQRVLCCTQYVRHYSRPHYTPEPDVVHELMGHAPMLCIPAVADLSERIGQAAARASEPQLQQLATLYWYTIEYGVMRHEGRLRAYGAGLLSSSGELGRLGDPSIRVRPFQPDEAKDVPYPITTYQPLLWEVPSLRAACEMMDQFVRRLGLGA